MTAICEQRISGFVKKHSRTLAAKILDVSIQSIHYALKENRDIRFVDYGDGSYSSYEVKELSQRKKI